MGRVTLTLPRLGETMEEAKVVAWLVTPGAAFRRGDVLMEVETDKTVVEVPALADGVLAQCLVAEGDTVSLDQPIAEVEVEGEAAEAAAQIAPDKTRPPVAPLAPPTERTRAAGLRASPRARAAARRAGVDLTLVPGTGRNGRVTGADVASATAGLSRQGTVVLLHGLFDSHRGWRDLPQRLARRGHAVIAPDLPGHGDNPDIAATPDEAATAMATLIARQAPGGPLALVGHSFGAVLAVRLASLLAPRVVKLVLIAPAGLGLRINADFVDGMLSAETTAALGRSLALLDAAPISDGALAAELQRVKARRADLLPLVRSVVSGGIQQVDLRQALARLTCPLTVVFGTNDRILDWQSVSELPSAARIHLVRGAGHMPHAALPELVPDLLSATFDARERKATV